MRAHVGIHESSGHSTVTRPGNVVEVHRHEVSVDDELAGLRLDQGLARALPEYSRSRIRQWIDAGEVTMDGQPAKPRDKLRAGAQIVLTARLAPVIADAPEPIALDIVHE